MCARGERLACVRAANFRCRTRPVMLILRRYLLAPVARRKIRGDNARAPVASAKVGGYRAIVAARGQSRGSWKPNPRISSNMSSRCPHNMVNFGPLAADIDPVVWGTPANFNGFRVLAAFLQGTPVLGISQTLRRSTESATYIRQGGHHVGRWPTF